MFTNLTRDHLDYHKTVDAYLAAKKSFFDGLDKEAFALTNIDDRNGEVMLQNCPAAHRSYSLRSDADFRGRIVESRLDGTLLSLNGSEIETMFTGRFNAYNLTAVYGASILLGWDREQVLVNMSRLVPVAGRFQAFHSPAGATAIVDYAHTPDAVVNVLNAIRDVIGNRGEIITVVGAGGNRDKGKRRSWHAKPPHAATASSSPATIRVSKTPARSCATWRPGSTTKPAPAPGS